MKAGPSDRGGVCGSASVQTVSDYEIFFCISVSYTMGSKRDVFSQSSTENDFGAGSRGPQKPEMYAI